MVMFSRQRAKLSPRVEIKMLEHTTKNMLKEIKQAHKALLALGIISHGIPDKDFWIEHGNFISLLKDFLNENQSWTHSLRKKDVLYIISLCSSFRPKEPHSILSNIAMQFDALTNQ